MCLIKIWNVGRTNFQLLRKEEPQDLWGHSGLHVSQEEAIVALPKKQYLFPSLHKGEKVFDDLVDHQEDDSNIEKENDENL